MLKKIKINMHLTEICNFHCKYCFAHFEEHKMLGKEDWIQIIDNCLDTGLVSEINFAGGEPMLCPYLTELASYVNSKGIPCSIITNGSMMSERWIKKYAGLFKTIGISVDSMNKDTMYCIGRCTTGGKYVSASEIADITHWIKKYYPDVKIKINTVVNALNKNENPAENIVMNNIPVDRWKLLKMCPFSDAVHDNTDMAVSDKEYFAFVENNIKTLGSTEFSTGRVLYKVRNSMEVVAEKDINGAYFMIDAGGYLVDDTRNSNYVRVINCAEEPFITGLEKLTFIEDIYNARYEE